MVFNTGGRYSPGANSWVNTGNNNAPLGRNSHTAVWTGSEMIVWGGEGEEFPALDTGGKYGPATDTWTATSTTDAPAGRGFHTAVWTGSEMIVWGGVDENSLLLNTGGKYDPYRMVGPLPLQPMRLLRGSFPRQCGRAVK